jgi:hypothetical protein
LTASSITQYTFSFIKSFLKSIAALQETATKAMQTARLAKLLGKQQETRSPSPLPVLAARLTRTFQPPRSGKTASRFCTTYKIITGADLGKLLDEVAARARHGQDPQERSVVPSVPS